VPEGAVILEIEMPQEIFPEAFKVIPLELEVFSLDFLSFPETRV